MSDLQKFQASDSWRRNLKKFLLMERKPEIVQNATITSQRYSLDISEDLKSIIEREKKQKSDKILTKEQITNTSNMSAETHEKLEREIVKDISEQWTCYNESAAEKVPIWQRTSDESFETMEKMCEETVSDPNIRLSKYLHSEPEQERNNIVVWQKTSDESFEALERMCDKTASDPNSTLFKYLHTDHKEEILAEVKKRSTDGPKSLAQVSVDQLLSKINNCTLLDDVEAPSRMWESTICGDTMLQTSPVKMVGLLRPSTIIEETPDDSANSDISSRLSFQSAAKSAQTDVSTSTYESAHDFTVGSNKSNLSNKFRIDDAKEVNADEDLLVILDKSEAEHSPSFDALENTIVEPGTLSKQSDAPNDFKGSNTPVNLIDLEETFGPAHCSHQEFSPVEGEQDFENKNNSYNFLDDSVIEIMSDDEDGNAVALSTNDAYKTNIKTEITSSTTSVSSDSFSFNQTNDDDKENNLRNREQLQNSMHFNDTMEEVEYMLKRGMEYMAAEAAAKNSREKINLPPSFASSIKEQNAQPISPLKQLRSAKPASSSSVSNAKPSTYTTPAKRTPLTKGSASTPKRFDIDIRPFPKLDIFAKPLAQTRTKEMASKQQKFSHIISPIGTYMKKTAQTPLMSSINCKSKDYFNSTAIMELENESRLYKPHFQTTSHEEGAEGLPKLPGLIIDAKRPLPKKAYISSDLKHIVDERTPITIPASKKIQKYLDSAMMPAVLRHDGKFKMPGGISNKINASTTSSGMRSKLPLKDPDTNSVNSKPTTHTSRRNNASFADLSVMSGDVSMYTIMDAQKF